MIVRLCGKNFRPKFKKLSKLWGGDQPRVDRFLERPVRYRMYMWRFVVDGRRRCPIFSDLPHQEKIEKNALYEEKELCTVRAD